MINTLARIDYLASAGSTPWHRASALTKLVVASALVLLAIFTRSLALLTALQAVVLGLALSSRTPLRLILLAGGYPLVIAGLFVLATWDGTWSSPLRLLLRPLTASLTMVWLVSTTPYPDLFAPLSRVLPRSAGDGLFLTYRALFDLIGRAERLWRALRIRGGVSVPVRRRLTLAGESLGTLVLHGFERGERLYATMRLRGHSGRICGCRHYLEMSRADLAVAAVGGLVMVLAVLLGGRP
jgi:cobalt/nickel transport system permease protein